MYGGGDYGIEKGVYNLAGELVGRVDVYDIHTGQAWEVKSVGTQASAYPQLERYLGNHLKDGTILTAGDAGRFHGEFVVNYLDSSYLVSYQTPSTGVVTYSVKEITFQKECEYVYVPAKERKIAEETEMNFGHAPQSISAPLILLTLVGGGALICGKLLGGGNLFSRTTVCYN